MTEVRNANKQTLVFCSKQLVNRCNRAKTDPWINRPDFAGDPIRMKQSWQLRSQKQLYQVIRDTQMSFLLLSSGTQITLSTEACEKKLAHRDLLMGLRWNWIRCKPTFLDTIRYLEITEGLRRQQAQSFSVHKGQLMVLALARQCHGWTLQWVAY